METAPEKVFDTVVTRLRTESDPLLRRNLLRALGVASGAYGEKARLLIFDPMLRSTEAPTVLFTEAGRPQTREAAWTWFTANYDEIMKHMPEGYRVRVPFVANTFCSDEKAAEVERFFQPRIGLIPGGHRSLAAALEQIHLCAAQVKAHSADAAKLFQ
jgi:hypothetical protein